MHELGLLERGAAGTLTTPYDEIVIHAGIRDAGLMRRSMSLCAAEPPGALTLTENHAVRGARHGSRLVGDDDLVGIPPLGEEELAVVGELLLAGVARNQGEEMGYAPIGLGSQYAAEALGLFLP